MNIELRIVERIKEESREYERFESEKIAAPTIGQERAILLEMEKKKAYIAGLTEALSIMQR